MNYKFNINESVKVKLTQKGISILEEKRNDLNRLIKENGGEGFGPYEVKKDEYGYSEFQMWNLMANFGEYMTLGLEVPFETNIIISDEKLSVVNPDERAH